MPIPGVIRPLLASKQRRDVLLALTAAYLLVQLASLPVAISIPTLAKRFGTTIDDTAWIVIIYLLMLGSFVLLAARMGDRYGHMRVFFVGIVVATIGSGLIALSQDLWQVVLWRAVAGLGSAMILGNSNAILAAAFPPEERGRAFAVPIIGARFGTLLGLVLFGVFLHFFSWRLVFVSFVPIGLLAMAAAIPALRMQEQPKVAAGTGRPDWFGGALLVATAVVLILSASHLHGGEQSFVSSEGVRYHLPLQIVFLVLLAVFVLVERRVSNPVIDMRHFRQKPFSLALGSNVTYHFSMLATMTLVPILVEEGFGKSPLFVIVVLLPSQTLGLFMPMVAGWIYDRHRPRMMRPATMASIAGGFLVLGLAAPHIAFWALPLLMLPISIGTNMFNPINNAAVMNSLPLEHRGVASGMLETTRELGHALGATAAAGALALTLPIGIDLLSGEAAQRFYIDGFRIAAIMVVFALMAGATLAYFHNPPPPSVRKAEEASPEPSYQPSGDD